MPTFECAQAEVAPQRTRYQSSLAFCLCVLLLAAAFAPGAKAGRVVLDFEGFEAHEAVLDFYAGGAGHLGSTGGPDLGVEFDLAAAMTRSLPNIPSGTGVMSFDARVGTVLTMNAAGGFSGPVRLDYTSENIEVQINSYSGLNGTGALLGTQILNPIYIGNASDPAPIFDVWLAAELQFSSTAQSLLFESTGTHQPGSTLDSRGAFFVDDISFEVGTATVPVAPTWALMLLSIWVMSIGRSRKAA